LHAYRWLALSRVYRAAKRRKVVLKRYVMAGTVEERVGQVQEDKRALAETTIYWVEAMKEVVSLHVIEAVAC
jgi:SNF2 family DNA or RNA helicase